jgi:hypothetical protein
VQYKFRRTERLLRAHMFSQRHRFQALEVLAMLEAESITIALDRSATVLKVRASFPFMKTERLLEGGDHMLTYCRRFKSRSQEVVDMDANHANQTTLADTQFFMRNFRKKNLQKSKMSKGRGREGPA